MKWYYLFICVLFVSMVSFAQEEIKNLGASIIIEQQGNNGQYISKNTVHLLTIGIKNFKDKKFDTLHSASALDRYGIVSKNVLPLSYEKHPEPIFLTASNVNVSDVRDAFVKLKKEVSMSDIIIISILSHGVIDKDDGEYYLICSDTDSRDYASTAIPGSEIRAFLEYMANNGAAVIVFIDTCHAAALFDKTNFSLNSNGLIAYYASSSSNQNAKEIYHKCRFTEVILDVFQNKNQNAFNEYGFVTLKSLEAQIKASLSSITEQNQQTPVFAYFTNNDHVDEFCIIKKNEFIEYGSIWQNPSPFSPFAVSPNKGRGLDYLLIGVEGVSLAGMILCGPILQTYYKNKISKEKNIFSRNEYKRKGKKASIGFCVSSGLLISSYIARALHVHYHLSIRHKERQFATLDMTPAFSGEYNGFTLVLNF